MTNNRLVRAGNGVLALGVIASALSMALVFVTPANAETDPTPSPTASATETPAETPAETPTGTPTETPTATPTTEPSAVPQQQGQSKGAILGALAVAPIASSNTASWSDLHTDMTAGNNVDFDNFKDLNVTVSQTDNLVNQGVRVSWTGGKQTSASGFATNYLVIMQCWGDEAEGPSPEHCEYGAPNASIAGQLGRNASDRGLREGEDALLIDPLTHKYPPSLMQPAPNDNPFLRAFAYPFEAVNGDKGFDLTPFFTSSTSNEVSGARTGADGTGFSTFEVQTSLEAPQLGCGAAKTGGGIRDCWLVIVPRGDHNLSGSYSPTATTAGRVTGSPLSPSAWKNRIVFKLGFRSVASSCPLGSSERRVIGSELISSAMTSWQPELCADGTVYGFSQLGDSESRNQIVSDLTGASKFAFVTNALGTDASSGLKIQYAPVADSALVVAYNIDYRLSASAPIASKNGTQVTNLVLNARLLAKLLTQSYRVDIPDAGAADGLSHNPESITTDPEFVSLNPDFAYFQPGISPEGLIVELGSTDANAIVWKWLRSDPQARDFLSGNADGWGMIVNPYYKALALDTTPTESFPKADLTTYQGGDAPPPGFGTLDLRPYSNDMQDAALRVLRGDAGSKTFWDSFRTPPAYVSAGTQVPGQKFQLALVDAPSAERFGLNVAKLVNGANEVIAPTETAIRKTITAAGPDSTTGVRTVDPRNAGLGTYPLAMPVYAVVNVCASSKAELNDYAKLLDYAVGAGQVSGDEAGQLPLGYVPLVSDDVTLAQKAATSLRKVATTGGDCPKEETTTDDDGGSTDYGFTDSSDGGGDPVVPTSTGTPTPAAVQVTEDDPMPLAAFGAPASALIGFPSLVIGPLLAARGRRRGKALAV